MSEPRGECAECGRVWKADELEPFEDVLDLEPGDEVPLGRCPGTVGEGDRETCGVSCFLVRPVPISRPGSTLEDLHNDLAALECAHAVVLAHAHGEPPSRLNDANAEACEAWLRAKIAETENTIDALEGAGPPLESTAPLCEVCGERPGTAVVVGRTMAAPVAGGTVDVDVEQERTLCDECREAKS